MKVFLILMIALNALGFLVGISDGSYFYAFMSACAAASFAYLIGTLK